MKVASVDPGRKGYECVLDAGSAPTFLPAPLTQRIPSSTFLPSKAGEITEPVHDPDGDYDPSLMFRIATSWAAQGVRLVVLEKQAPQRRGFGSQGKEGSWASWTNGYGYGLWEMSLVAAGFYLVKEEEIRPGGLLHSTLLATDSKPFYVIADPQVWKRRMAAVASHQGEDTRGARKRANDLRTIEVAHRVDPTLDLRALERGGGKKTADSPDKAASFLLAIYGYRWILGFGQEVPEEGARAGS